MNNLPIIAGVEITTDAEGRFSLNALHKASGEGREKGPSFWLRLDQAKDLVAELENKTTQICVVSLEGRNGGTFAHKLLAISYAGWISPSFQLQVNQVFLDYKTGQIHPVKPIQQMLPTDALLGIPSYIESIKLLFPNLGHRPRLECACTMITRKDLAVAVVFWIAVMAVTETVVALV